MNKRRSAERAGRFAETVAALWLTFKGYRVLARRARTPYGEVDIAAFKNGMLVVVEVKSRATIEGALTSVGAFQRSVASRRAAFGKTMAGHQSTDTAGPHGCPSRQLHGACARRMAERRRNFLTTQNSCCQFVLPGIRVVTCFGAEP